MASLDALFELFSDERRRYALYYLHERNGPVPVGELVDAVADWTDDPPERPELRDETDRLRLEFEHHHLPKTASVEFVQYHPERGTIEVRGAPPEFDALVTVARVIERSDND